MAGMGSAEELRTGRGTREGEPSRALQKVTSMSLLELPDELLLYILSHLWLRDLQNALLTCKRIHALLDGAGEDSQDRPWRFMFFTKAQSFDLEILSKVTTVAPSKASVFFFKPGAWRREYLLRLRCREAWTVRRAVVRTIKAALPDAILNPTTPPACSVAFSPSNLSSSSLPSLSIAEFSQSHLLFVSPPLESCFLIRSPFLNFLPCVQIQLSPRLPTFNARNRRNRHHQAGPNNLEGELSRVELTCVASDRKGKRLLLGYSNGTVSVCDWTTWDGKTTFCCLFETQTPVTQITTQRSDVVATGANGKVRRWRISDQTIEEMETPSTTPNTRKFLCLTTNNQGSVVAVTTQGQVLIWAAPKLSSEVERGNSTDSDSEDEEEEEERFRLHPGFSSLLSLDDPAVYAAVHGSKIVVVSKSGMLMCWDSACSPSPLRTWQAAITPPDTQTKPLVASNSRWVVTASGSSVSVWRLWDQPVEGMSFKLWRTVNIQRKTEGTTPEETTIEAIVTALYVDSYVIAIGTSSNKLMFYDGLTVEHIRSISLEHHSSQLAITHISVSWVNYRALVVSAPLHSTGLQSQSSSKIKIRLVELLAPSDKSPIRKQQKPGSNRSNARLGTSPTGTGPVARNRRNTNLMDDYDSYLHDREERARARKRLEALGVGFAGLSDDELVRYASLLSQEQSEEERRLTELLDRSLSYTSSNATSSTLPEDPASFWNDMTEEEQLQFALSLSLSESEATAVPPPNEDHQDTGKGKQRDDSGED